MSDQEPTEARPSSKHRSQWLAPALIAAVASIGGGAVAGAASYLATQSSNNAMVQRQEKHDALAEQTSARLVDEELAEVAVQLAAAKQRATTLSPGALGGVLRRLPDSAWKANQHMLARTLTYEDWGNVNEIYEFIAGFQADRKALYAKVTIPFLQKLVTQARNTLEPYEYS